MNTLKMSWWFRNEATCCETHGPCNQGRDCPARHPAEAATEIGADSPPMSRTDAWLLISCVIASWAVIGIAVFIGGAL